MKRQIAIGTQEKEIEIVRQGEQIRVTIDGALRTLTVLQRDGAWTVLGYQDDEGRSQLLRLAGSAQGDTRRLWVDGKTLTYLLVGRQSPVAAGQDSLSAAIPAVVSEILVAIGDNVAAGDVLILLESMKMVIPITAPYASTVRALHCEPGAAVQPGVELVSLTTTPPSMARPTLNARTSHE